MIALAIAVGLLIIVGIVAAIASSAKNTASDPDPSTPSTSIPSAGAPAAPKTGPGLGDAVRDGKFEFVVSKVKCGVKQVGSAYVSKKAQGQFCLYTMSVENIGNKAETFDASPQKAISPDGTQYDSDSEAAIYANTDNTSFLTSINPGNKIVGVIVVFDIPKGAKIATLELHDSLLSSGTKVSVS